MKHGESKRKKRLIAGALAAALLIPTTGFAYQSIMADGIYGSFENLKTCWSNDIRNVYAF